MYLEEVGVEEEVDGPDEFKGDSWEEKEGARVRLVAMRISSLAGHQDCSAGGDATPIVLYL